jgi:hypothetical protein
MTFMEEYPPLTRWQRIKYWLWYRWQNKYRWWKVKRSIKSGKFFKPFTGMKTGISIDEIVQANQMTAYKMQLPWRYIFPMKKEQLEKYKELGAIRDYKVTGISVANGRLEIDILVKPASSIEYVQGSIPKPDDMSDEDFQELYEICKEVVEELDEEAQEPGKGRR